MDTSLSLNQKITNLILAILGWREQQGVSEKEPTAVPMPLKQVSLNQLDIKERVSDKTPVKMAFQDRFTGTVGIFSHYRDAIAAALDLKDMGLPMNWITLIARDCKHYQWMPGLNLCDRFDESFLGLAEESEQFLYRRFNRGKYLVKVEGTNDAIHCAKNILSRRRNSEVRYF